VDAGHGGEDTGARGPSGVREKDVALSIARKLAKLINNEPGMKAVLIRDGDYYIGLRERTIKARKVQADLFVSVHADAFRDRDARGSSVYVLSQRGASSEHARSLAARENASDLVGGVRLTGKNDRDAFLLSVLQDTSMEASFDVASRVLGELRDVNDLHKRDVQQAGFMVLKSPDIPSLLVETAFISNRKEERRLNSDDYQDTLARALLRGVKGYFSSYRPGRTLAEADPSNG
jgi:N-acetylmuramoyl-L-alanine amidase